MAKKINKENIRVEVHPVQSYLPENHINWADDVIKDCKDIIEQIKRHIDNVNYVGVEYDTREICEFCKSEWEVNKGAGAWGDLPIDIPVCCEKAQDEWKSKNKEKSNV